MNQLQQRILALAAAAQSAAAVKQLAREGSLRNAAHARVLFSSVMNQNPENFAAVYNDLPALRWGLEHLLDQIGASKQKDVEITRYMIGMLALERRLSKRPAALEQLGQRITKLHRQQYEFSFTQDTITAGMAGIYSELISPLGQPIKINGKPDYLQQPNIQNQIRALLLAGIRNVVLWRQLGGKRRQFIFSRQRMVSTAQQLLRDLREQSEPES